MCPKARKSSPITISLGQAVALQSRCHIPMIDHLITADEMEDLEVYSTWLDWTMTLSQLFDNNNAEQITSAVNKIRDTITGSSMFGMFALIALLSFLSW